MNVTAQLTDWRYDKRSHTLVGWVSNDQGNENRPAIMSRFRDGDRIQTSTVQEFLEDGLYARTLNSIYKLDPPFKETNGTVPSQDTA